MADTVYIIPGEEIRKLRRRQIDGLPYGILEVTASGTIINYFPSHAQASPGHPPQAHGLNIFEDAVLGTLLQELRQRWPSLTKSGDATERLLLICPFAKETIRLSVVVTALGSAQVRISLSRLFHHPARRV